MTNCGIIFSGRNNFGIRKVVLTAQGFPLDDVNAVELRQALRVSGL